jgi:hypothetical protein
MPKRFLADDKAVIAEKICDVHSKRKRKRRLLEKQWAEIDRQLAMDPDITVRKQRQSELEEAKAWMAETELPNQSETLEISTADARRLIMPKGAHWFNAHVALTDDYLDRVDYQSLVAGDKNEVPTKITQDNADKYVRGALVHWHNQYDFKGNADLINAESFKYSMGVGRARSVNKRVFSHHSKGVEVVEQKIPILVPRSIKRTYLDDTCHALSNEGLIVAPGQIFEQTMLVKDILMASQKGSSDINDMQGGWIKNAFKGWDSDAQVTILEWEGDMVVGRKTTGSLYLANSIISVAIGYKSGKASTTMDRTVFRIRKNDMPFTSYLLFPYHQEHIEDPYATSPLMKGRPLQMAQTESLNRLMELAALQSQPPVSQDEDSDQRTDIYPGCVLGESAKVHEIGNPQAMLAIYQFLDGQYSDVTGRTAARLGAQTVSHTTAFAKDAELARGQVRINDYSDASLEGPWERWLQIAFQIGKKHMTGEDWIYISDYGGFARLKKKFLPDYVEFEAFGAGQPADENMRFQKRMAALQQAIQIDQMGVAAGMPPKLDLGQIIEQLLQEGGWKDTDVLLKQEELEPLEPNPGLQVAANQGLMFGQ